MKGTENSKRIKIYSYQERITQTNLTNLLISPRLQGYSQFRLSEKRNTEQKQRKKKEKRTIAT